VYWIHLAEDRIIVWVCKDGNEASGSIKFGEFVK
jgi:hypothetical protein